MAIQILKQAPCSPGCSIPLGDPCLPRVMTWTPDSELPGQLGSWLVLFHSATVWSFREEKDAWRGKKCGDQETT